MARRTRYGVFIIESLYKDEEGKGSLEGELLAGILDNYEIDCQYTYLRTIFELEQLISRFRTSGLRYLHISCHGEVDKIKLTLEDLPFDRLSFILADELIGRRLFLSSCLATNVDLASEFFKHGGPISIMGPTDRIRMDKSVAFWAAFYYLMSARNRNAMRKRDIEEVLEKCSGTFDQPMAYFSKQKTKSGYRSDYFNQTIFPDGTKIRKELQD